MYVQQLIYIYIVGKSSVQLASVGFARDLPTCTIYYANVEHCGASVSNQYIAVMNC